MPPRPRPVGGRGPDIPAHDGRDHHPALARIIRDPPQRSEETFGLFLSPQAPDNLPAALFQPVERQVNHVELSPEQEIDDRPTVPYISLGIFSRSLPAFAQRRKQSPIRMLCQYAPNRLTILTAKSGQSSISAHNSKTRPSPPLTSIRRKVTAAHSSPCSSRPSIVAVPPWSVSIQ